MKIKGSTHYKNHKAKKKKNHKAVAVTTHPLAFWGMKFKYLTDKAPELQGVHSIISFSLLKTCYMQVSSNGLESSSNLDTNWSAHRTIS